MAFVTPTTFVTPTLVPRSHIPHRRYNTCAVRPRTVIRAATEPATKEKPPAQTGPPKPPVRLSNAQVLAERLSDTAYDIRLHFSRLISRNNAPLKNGPRVVVLGTGWAAHSLSKVVDLSTLQSVTIISPRNFFFFTPLLSAAAVGTVELRSIVEPIRHANPYVDYFEASAVAIDTDAQSVKCIRRIDRVGESAMIEKPPQDGLDRPKTDVEFDVPYDVLVVAVGETTATFNVQGAKEYAYFLKELTDARLLRRNLLDSLERASLPIWTEAERRRLLHFVVVGGGPTGCEFAGELSDFISNDVAPRYGDKFVSEIRVTLLQSGKTLLNQFESSLQNVALKNFSGRVDVVFGARVTKVTDRLVYLQNGDEIPYGILVWAAGNATRDIVAHLINKLPPSNNEKPYRKLPVDPWLRVKGLANIFAMGDCAIIEDGALPSTAQVAGQQGLLSKASPTTLADEGGPIVRDTKDRILHPFRFLSLGIMAYLGNDRALVQVEATPSSNVKIAGRIAYLLWRSVYAVKQVDVRNRVLVLFDYFKSRVFGRDISEF